MRAFFLMQKTLKTKPAPFSIRPCSSFTAPLGRLETTSASALRQHLLAPCFLNRLSQSAPCSSEDCEARAKSWSELGDFSLGSKVLRMLDNGRCEAMCINNTKRLCHVHGKMQKNVWIAAGSSSSAFTIISCLCSGATGRSHTWTSISVHSCGRYEDSEQKAKDAKHDLQRYLHYYNCYKAHMDSCKLKAKLKEKIHLKLEALERKESIKLKHYSWVTNAVNKLFRSRRILSLSYPFAYFMFGDDLFRNEMTKEVRKIKKNLFEDQQQQLEANIEKLSMCLEEPFDNYDEDRINNIRMQILTMSTIVDNLCKKMYECIDNDLLGSLQLTTMVIAPYSSRGVEKAMAI